MYKKILMPIDGSPHSEKAEQTALLLAKTMNAEITLLHVAVMPQYTAFFGETPIPIPQETIDQVEKIGKSLLEKHAADFTNSGIKVTTRLIFGNPAETICRTAKDKFDLIVIGSRGLGEIKGYLLGSVSDRVSHYAPCSVLIVH